MRSKDGGRETRIFLGWSARARSVICSALAIAFLVASSALAQNAQAARCINDGNAFLSELVEFER
jgi:hypothetical protein